MKFSNVCLMAAVMLLSACKPEEAADRDRTLSEPLPTVESSHELGKPLVKDVSPPEVPPGPQTVPALPALEAPGENIRGGAENAATKPAPPVPTSKPRPEPKLEEKLPEVSLDLTLPEELAESLTPAKEEAFGAEASVLPPMFNPRESSFSLNGRIISEEREQDIDGAELRLEFRH